MGRTVFINTILILNFVKQHFCNEDMLSNPALETKYRFIEPVRGDQPNMNVPEEQPEDNKYNRHGRKSTRFQRNQIIYPPFIKREKMRDQGQQTYYLGQKNSQGEAYYQKLTSDELKKHYQLNQQNQTSISAERPAHQIPNSHYLPANLKSYSQNQLEDLQQYQQAHESFGHNIHKTHLGPQATPNKDQNELNEMIHNSRQAQKIVIESRPMTPYQHLSEIDMQSFTPYNLNEKMERDQYTEQTQSLGQERDNIEKKWRFELDMPKIVQSLKEYTGLSVTGLKTESGGPKNKRIGRMGSVNDIFNEKIKIEVAPIDIKTVLSKLSNLLSIGRRSIADPDEYLFEYVEIGPGALKVDPVVYPPRYQEGKLIQLLKLKALRDAKKNG